MNVAIVLAGGRGSRMKSSVPKQYLSIKDHPVLYYSLKQFEENDFVDKIVIVAGKEYVDYCKKEIVDKYHITKVCSIVEGGTERYDSVYNALCEIDRLNQMTYIENVVKINSKEDRSTHQQIVFIHDGARACVTQQIINDCYLDAKKYKTSIAAVPVKDTIKIVDQNGYSIDTPARDTMWQVQTPQTFAFSVVFDAYKKMYENKRMEQTEKEENQSDNREHLTITDDAMVVEHFGDTKVKMTLSNYSNIKITTPEDLQIADIFIRSEND